MSKKNLPSVHAVADYFLLKVFYGSGDGLTNLKLQKLVYYAQAWSLALRNTPMFKERIEAWAGGPVCPALYRRLKGSGWQLIDPSFIKKSSVGVLSGDDEEFLDDVWEKYGGLWTAELRELTHREAPWKEAYGNLPPGSRCTQEISWDAMEKFYKKQWEKESRKGGG